MSKSAILSSSIAKKYWMAFTGLFLCLFLVGHLLGNLQLIFISGEEGRRAFNEYAFFMTHNPAVKVLSYLTYFSILFHAIDGLLLAVKNKKARPQGYAYNNQGANTSTPARMMAVLGTIVLVFISTHMVNFWAKMHFDNLPLHSIEKSEYIPQIQSEIAFTYVLTDKGTYERFSLLNPNTNSQDSILTIRNGSELFEKSTELRKGEALKDLHGLVMAFFGKSKSGYETNGLAGLAVALYVLSMAVLAFHLWHGFSSAFQSLGVRVGSYKNIIEITGKVFSVIVPLLFAIIPLYIFLS